MNPYSPPAAYAPAYRANPSGDAGTIREVGERAVQLLRQTRPWVMFLSVLLFLGTAFMLLAGIGLVVSGLAMGGPTFSNIIGLAYIPVALVYLYPAIKMWTYGSAISRLVISGATTDLEAALAQQKHLWKFLGIAAIVMMVIYLVAFGVIAAMAVGSRWH
jgi:hypothetical protein